MRTHLIMNSHRLTTFRDIKAEVTETPSKAKNYENIDITPFDKLSKANVFKIDEENPTD